MPEAYGVHLGCITLRRSAGASLTTKTFSPKRELPKIRGPNTDPNIAIKAVIIRHLEEGPPINRDSQNVTLTGNLTADALNVRDELCRL